MKTNVLASETMARYYETRQDESNRLNSCLLMCTTRGHMSYGDRGWRLNRVWRLDEDEDEDFICWLHGFVAPATALAYASRFARMRGGLGPSYSGRFEGASCVRLVLRGVSGVLSEKKREVWQGYGQGTFQ